MVQGDEGSTQRSRTERFWRPEEFPKLDPVPTAMPMIHGSLDDLRGRIGGRERPVVTSGRWEARTGMARRRMKQKVVVL